jgi:multidrug efflux system membrane fusion protein
MRIQFSYILAIALAGGISYYMLTGKTVVSGQADAHPATIAERQNEDKDDLFAVQVQTFTAETRSRSLDIRGRTEAESSVSVRAETGGIIETRHVDKGDRVAAGDLLCTIETASREAKVLEASAALIQANVNLEAAEKLAGRGFSAKNQIPALQAARDAAKARLHETELDLSRTKIRAPIAGIAQDPIAEKGGMLQTGDVCVTLIDRNPMIIVGQVSEREIGKLELGMSAMTSLATGETTTGNITYIAPSADAQTRTFRVEITIPNDDETLKDGVTALAQVQLEGAKAHRIPASVMTLADDGRVGVRTVDDKKVVSFTPVNIIGGTVDGMWVTGLPDEVSIIIVGQEFVLEGQTVQVETQS